MAGVPDWVVSAEDAGRQVKLLPGSEVFESMAQAILASDEAIEKQPEVVGGVVRATLMGMRDIIADPRQAAATFAAAVPAYKGREASLNGSCGSMSSTSTPTSSRSGTSIRSAWTRFAGSTSAKASSAARRRWTSFTPTVSSSPPT